MAVPITTSSPNRPVADPNGRPLGNATLSHPTPLPVNWLQPNVHLTDFGDTTLELNRQYWLYQFHLPPWNPRGPQLSFQGMLNTFTTLFQAENQNWVHLLFYYRPDGALLWSFIGGWEMQLITPGSFVTATGYPPWASGALYDGDALGVALKPVYSAWVGMVVGLGLEIW